MTELAATACTADTTSIHAIQGDDFQSPLIGREVTVRGIITHIAGDGVFIESVTADATPDTSEGLFVQTSQVIDGVTRGTLLAARGMVTELGDEGDTLTALAGQVSIIGCTQHLPLPLTARRLPMSERQREASEGMRIEFEQALAVTDVYRMSRGQIFVSADHPLPAPTEIARPGNDARELERLNRQNLMSMRLSGVPTHPFPAGSGLARVQGVLGHDGRRQLLLAQEDLNPVVPGLPFIAPPAAGDLRVLSLNLHNYFNGDGDGSGFRTNRGAATPGEFIAQRQRLRATLHWAQPHITAVVELENDGFTANSAAADFVSDLEQATGHTWQLVYPGVEKIGPDMIRVGLFYRPDRVQVLGEATVLEGPEFHHLSRPPLAQVFAPAGGQEPFLVVVNHLKSKGSCPESGPNANQLDGQSCWNHARVAAAEAMTRWAKGLATAQSGGRVLLLGDFNAYRMEDPVRHILDSGLEDLTAPAGLGHQYTYFYYGRSGTLDYAFASRPLRPFIWNAQILHINAAYPPSLPLAEDWLRSSDHDPVMVDLRFSQSSTQP